MKNIVEIQEEFRINQGNQEVILEKGDKIKLTNVKKESIDRNKIIEIYVEFSYPDDLENWILQKQREYNIRLRKMFGSYDDDFPGATFFGKAANLEKFLKDNFEDLTVDGSRVPLNWNGNENW